MFHFILRSDGNVGGMARQQLQTNLQLSAVDKMMKINPDLSNNYAKVLYKLASSKLASLLGRFLQIWYVARL